jgi:hypothetical protein
MRHIILSKPPALLRFELTLPLFIFLVVLVCLLPPFFVQGQRNEYLYMDDYRAAMKKSALIRAVAAYMRSVCRSHYLRFVIFS